MGLVNTQVCHILHKVSMHLCLSPNSLWTLYCAASHLQHIGLAPLCFFYQKENRHHHKLSLIRWACGFVSAWKGLAVNWTLTTPPRKRELGKRGACFSEELIWKRLLWDLARERQALLPCLTSLTLELIVYLWSCVWEWTYLWACVWEWACVCVC